MHVDYCNVMLLLVCFSHHICNTVYADVRAVSRWRRPISTAHAYAIMEHRRSASQDMAVAVRVLLAALLGVYWSSSRVEGNDSAKGVELNL